MYIISYFMFSDAVSTISQISSIVQGQITGFSPRLITMLSLVTAITSILGCLLFLWLSHAFHFSTKTSLLVIIVLTAVVPLWGCFGISMDHFGIKVCFRGWRGAL